MGTLYLVSTPIGNLKDITLRAIETLKSVDVIVCEDSRISGRLLNEYGIETRMISVNDFNEDARSSEVINLLLTDCSVAIISDAGTPLVSDPGYKIVSRAIENDIKIEPIPGPSAFVSALIVSGMPPDKFMFCGFLPKKEGKRKELFANLKKIRETVKTTFIFYESPYRIKKTLEEVFDVFGDIDIALCRELTKLHEETIRGKLTEVREKIDTKPKGEFVVVF